MTRKMTITPKKEKIKQWEEVNKKAIEEYNKAVEKEGLILKYTRIF